MVVFEKPTTSVTFLEVAEALHAAKRSEAAQDWARYDELSLALARQQNYESYPHGT